MVHRLKIDSAIHYIFPTSEDGYDNIPLPFCRGFVVLFVHRASTQVSQLINFVNFREMNPPIYARIFSLQTRDNTPFSRLFI